jgi:hypothetical protein
MEAGEGLEAARVAGLVGTQLVRSASGEWRAEFTRGPRTATTYTVSRQLAETLSPAAAELIGRIAEAVGSDDDRVWWARCAERLGRGAVDRALGLLKEAKQTGIVKNPGGLLTKFFQDIAREAGASLL